jgi:acetyl esterase/lipase
MKRLLLGLLSLTLVVGCARKDPQPDQPEQKVSLPEARRGFQTKLVRKVSAKEPVPKPPADLFRTVHYESPAGKLAAYVSQPPKDGKKHPAIIWIFGGFGNGIGETAWKEADPENDQSARAFREAGIVMMYPSLRGGNDNPGFNEGFFGEVDDVLAVRDYLARQDFVDPERLYLGGHSTGGTLVLLVAASSDRFRAVFSFGPVEDVAGYGPKVLPFDLNNPRELELRSPRRWLQSIHCPVFVFEGTGEPGNLGSLQTLSRTSRNPLVHFYPVQGTDHFSILAPVTKVIAGKILGDQGAKTNIAFTENELNASFGK